MCLYISLNEWMCIRTECMYCMYVRKYVRMYVYVCSVICMHLWMYIYLMYVQVCMYVFNEFVCIQEYIHIYLSERMYVSIFV